MVTRWSSDESPAAGKTASGPKRISILQCRALLPTRWVIFYPAYLKSPDICRDLRQRADISSSFSSGLRFHSAALLRSRESMVKSAHAWVRFRASSDEIQTENSCGLVYQYWGTSLSDISLMKAFWWAIAGEKMGDTKNFAFRPWNRPWNP